MDEITKLVLSELSKSSRREHQRRNLISYAGSLSAGLCGIFAGAGWANDSARWLAASILFMFIWINTWLWRLSER
jgi:hypothetical protein